MDQSTVARPRSIRLDELLLSSTEAFVLAQVDGAATLDEVADATGVPIDQVITIARRLLELGAIECPTPGSRVASSRYADVGRPRVETVERVAPKRRSSRKLAAAGPVAGAKPGRASQAKLRAARAAEPTPSKPKAPRRPSRAIPSARVEPPAPPPPPPAPALAPPPPPAPALTPPPQPPPPLLFAAPTSVKAALNPPVSAAKVSVAKVEPLVPSSRPQPSVRRLVAAAKSATLLEEAQKALVDGDAIAAANLYRLALEYAEDPTSRAYAESGLNEARSLVADTYLKKALSDEKELRWTEAVAAYEKALDRRPEDPAICERLANALRQEGQDLARAAKLAELATSRKPRSSACRRTLGLIYADSGQREKALEQFEKALELEPSDEVTTRAISALRKRR